MEDKRKTISFTNLNKKTLFTIKDGDSIRVSIDGEGKGEVRKYKCRYLDGSIVRMIGRETYDDEISLITSRLSRAGIVAEPIPKQKPILNILAAKYGEPLSDVEIPMTDAAIRRLVGGKYTVEPLNYTNGKAFGAVVSGNDGIAVCGMQDGVLTTLGLREAEWEKKERGVIVRSETYAEQLGRHTKEMSAGRESGKPERLPDAPDKKPAKTRTRKPAAKPSALGELEDAKVEASAYNATTDTPTITDQSTKRGEQDI